MDEEQAIYELKLIYRNIKRDFNPKVPLKDFLIYHFRKIRSINDGYYVMSDAKAYIEYLKVQLNV